jgi:hypothetical protein
VRQLARRDSRARLIRDLAAYVVELLAVGTVYFVLAKVGLTLASLNPAQARSGQQLDLPWRRRW